jgi:hypothetical protein
LELAKKWIDKYESKPGRMPIDVPVDCWLLTVNITACRVLC